ncbi:Uncharacterized protein BM_BM17093 [Brugia malayi]|uniref:Uncharacterized protein n=2 Tax=Brugia TaxID=6278 RepID=A0A4E9G2V2_BRUMA|nr:Uncharacterized protein BM_BM17093 [Brugia malayi]VDO50000.1 unnamed protein product [Brugia timori]VIO99761.1 Uncharacterized protein BM_BM17093 [Brugia malayi]
MELLGGFSICHLILFANELNGISAGTVHSKMLYNEGRRILRAARPRRIARLTTTTAATTTTTAAATTTTQFELMEVLASLKQRHSNCAPQQQIIQELEKGIIKHNTLEDYYFLLDEELRGELINLIAIASSVTDSSFVVENDKNDLAKFILENFLED